MINQSHELSLVKQCSTLDLARSGLYYQPNPISDEDLRLMCLIDKIHIKRPFLGSRRIRDALLNLGHTVNRKCVQRLMHKMGIALGYDDLNDHDALRDDDLLGLLSGKSICRIMNFACKIDTPLLAAGYFIFKHQKLNFGYSFFYSPRSIPNCVATLTFTFFVP